MTQALGRLKMARSALLCEFVRQEVLEDAFVDAIHKSTIDGGQGESAAIGRLELLRGVRLLIGMVLDRLDHIETGAEVLAKGPCLDDDLETLGDDILLISATPAVFFAVYNGVARLAGEDAPALRSAAESFLMAQRELVAVYASFQQTMGAGDVAH
ncbi:hypothetical protein LXM94_23350 [Rhizobium sp. TRM95111]|uniref:hypothetical protein n=1 Tax=Rhizobium alarense TaxID=2846851 RepID=UPI001F2ED1D0|nr:hypothetical protein [Rhizobium alarense]MCF3642906.1 hypothetical protein [Rhizobium alarense]